MYLLKCYEWCAVSNITFILFIQFLGGWWCVSTFSEIEGSIAIEMGKGTYVYSLDTGLFTLGGPHKECKSFTQSETETC